MLNEECPGAVTQVGVAIRRVAVATDLAAFCDRGVGRAGRPAGDGNPGQSRSSDAKAHLFAFHVAAGYGGSATVRTL